MSAAELPPPDAGTAVPIDPPFGLAGVTPLGVRAVWGARLIALQTGFVDFVADRQGCAGIEDARGELLELLTREVPMGELLAKIVAALVDGTLDTRQDSPLVVWDGPRVRVHANTNGSGGYVYLTAYEIPREG